VPPAGQQVISPTVRLIVTDILAGKRIKDVNPFWGKFSITGPDGRRPATLKTGTNNDAKDLNAYGYIAPPTQDGRGQGAYALRGRRLERQLGQQPRLDPRPTRCSRSTSRRTSGRASSTRRPRSGPRRTSSDRQTASSATRSTHSRVCSRTTARPSTSGSSSALSRRPRSGRTSAASTSSRRSMWRRASPTG
jgi:hypothetical protein